MRTCKSFRVLHLLAFSSPLLKTKSLAVAVLVACVASQSDAQSRHDRQRKTRDYFGPRFEFRQPRSESRHRNPITMQRFRTIDGSMNNLVRSNWGQAGVNLRRRTPVGYADGISTPSGADRLSAREISNLIVAQDQSFPSQTGLTSMVWQWGQFLDHDLDLTETVPTEPFFIDVPVGDLYFDPFGIGGQQIFLFRSEYRQRPTGARQQINSITSWIDGSNVYGSDDATALSLRTRSGGLLKQSEGGLLPVGEDGFFLAGDIRANEQLGLTAMHTLFVREHNRIARRLTRLNPRLNDEQIYLRARQRVIAIMQSITYNEFLPTLLGPRAIARYRGYNPAVNPNISNVFATAAYRVGHTMLNSQLWRLNNDSTIAEENHINLRDAFFNPTEIRNNGIDSIVKGLTVQVAQEVDAKVIDDVRNFLFGEPGEGGFDLASLNIQRGRDHGLPDLNTVRLAFGLPAHQFFDDITSDVALQLDLFDAYGSVDNIDPWVGMLAEDHVPGANVGSTIHRILKQQFEMIRDADRFWYQRNYRGSALEVIENTRLRNVIIRNSGVRNMQANVFRSAGRQ